MTITYPRSLPDNLRMTEAWFDLIDNVSIQPSGRGSFVNVSQVNDPAWQGKFITPILSRDVRPVWSSWRKSLRGGLKTFIAYDVRHKAPLAYPTATVPANIAGGWDGTVNVVTIAPGSDRSQLALNTLPTATYQFKAGDRIGLEQNSNYGYYEVLEDKAGVASAATITVSPFLHNTVFTDVAVCRVWRPLCQFIIDPTSWTEQGTVEDTPVSFTGIQRL